MKISVIVPVYNVEEFLVKCVESITNQTYRDLEIILVDDGSTDNCPMLCDTLAKSDERIRVVHKPNGGLSSARNAGLDIMTGDYVAFVDSDDFIHPQMYEVLLNILAYNDADIAGCQYSFVGIEENVDYEKITEPFDIDEIIICKEALADLTKYCHSVSLTSACMRLCKSELFDNLRFMEGYTEEDSLLLPFLWERADKIVRTKQKMYYWMERYGSITRQGFTPKKFDFIMVSYMRAKFFEERCLEKMKTHFSKEFMNRTVEYYCNAKHYGFEKEFSKYRKLYNKNWFKYFFTSDFCFNEYLMHICFRLHIPYGEKIYKKLNPDWLCER